MKYDKEQLIQMSSKTVLHVPLQRMSDRVKKAVLNGFDKGILPSVTGDTAKYYSIIADYMHMPVVAFSNKGSKYRGLHIKRMTVEMIEALSDWWKADRVVCRMENPTEWAMYTDSGFGKWYKHHAHEPEWAEYVGKEHWTVPILSDKSMDRFETIAKLITSSSEYQLKLDKVRQLINEGKTIEVEYAFDD